MSKKPNSGQTSKPVATIASELLRKPSTPAKVKAIAASVLSQAPNKPKPKGK